MKKDREEFYRPSEEPPPIELIQLNLEASVMCLVAKIKLHCGRVGSPAVRIRQVLKSSLRVIFFYVIKVLYVY